MIAHLPRRRLWLTALDFRSGTYDALHCPDHWRHIPAQDLTRGYVLGYRWGAVYQQLTAISLRYDAWRRHIWVSARWGAHQRHRGIPIASLGQVLETTQSIPWAFIAGYLLQGRSKG